MISVVPSKKEHITHKYIYIYIGRKYFPMVGFDGCLHHSANCCYYYEGLAMHVPDEAEGLRRPAQWAMRKTGQALLWPCTCAAATSFTVFFKRTIWSFKESFVIVWCVHQEYRASDLFQCRKQLAGRPSGIKEFRNNAMNETEDSEG